MATSRLRRRLGGAEDELTARPDYAVVGMLRIPETIVSPVRAISRRVAVVLLVMWAVVGIVYLDRDGYTDSQDGELSLLDCIYYATVSMSTTGMAT